VQVPLWRVTSLVGQHIRYQVCVIYDVLTAVPMKIQIWNVTPCWYGAEIGEIKFLRNVGNFNNQHGFINQMNYHVLFLYWVIPGHNPADRQICCSSLSPRRKRNQGKHGMRLEEASSPAEMYCNWLGWYERRQAGELKLCLCKAVATKAPFLSRGNG
jgi:hypothetical protein